MMKISTVFYNIGQGFKNIWRNKMFSLASVATMSACIFLFSMFYSLGVNFSSMVKSAEEGVAITVFFDEGITPAQIDQIGTIIAQRPEVSQYKYISAEEAWESFKLEYFAGNEDLAEGFADDNPLANSASFEIYLSDVAKQPQLVQYIQSIQGVRTVNQSEAAAKVLTDVNGLITVLFGAIIIILLAVSIFLINNTITVGISVRKDEIAIMKLIGAKDIFVRSPFIVEGVVIGLVGAAVPLCIMYFLYSEIIRYVAQNFGFLSGMVSFVSVETIFTTLAPIALILGVGIGYLGSRFTLHRHLRV